MANIGEPWSATPGLSGYAKVVGANILPNGGEAAPVERGETSGPSIPNGWFDILPYWDLANISGGTTAGLTVSIDEDVLFAGRPTIRVDIPAGTSGAKQLIGTSAATAYIPNPWDLTNLCTAVKSTNASIFASLAMTIGDATYANYWVKDKTKEGNPDGYSFANRNDEWYFLKCGTLTAPTTVPVGGGAPVVTNRMRAKISTVLTASTSKESIWFGFFGMLPARSKPTVIVSLDDGYATWFKFLLPLATYYKIPVSLSIPGSLLNVGNKMTTEQAISLGNHKSGLFDFINHSYSHVSLTTMSLNESVEDYERNREFMRNTLGIKGDGPSHIAYVGGVTSLPLYAAIKNRGFLTGRKNQLCWMHGQDQTLGSGEDDGRFVQNTVTVLDNTTTLVDVQTAIDGVIARNEVGLLEGHNFASASGADTWSYQNMEGLFADLASRRDAGTIEVKSISRWYADLTGRPCSLL